MLNLSFVLFVIIILITRILILFHINIPFIDSDQPFMWAGVKDYSEGHFFEPRFYGQNYNTFLEALFAVPLFWMGLPVYYALPIATHVISLFPFLFPAFYLFFHNKKENALLILALLVCLTTGYDILNSIPRGFVTGLFFTSFFILSFLRPTNRRYLALNTVLALLGYFVNPNSILVSLPFLFYLFLHNYKDKRYYLHTFVALLSAIPFYLVFDLFYKIHPNYVVLELQYSLTTKFFWDILSHPDVHFAHISFLMEEKSAVLFLVLGVLGITLFRQNKKLFYTFLVFLGVILLSFFSGKAKDGVVWPFYSYSRIFLGIPVMLALFTMLIAIRSRAFLMGVVMLSLGFSCWKFYRFKETAFYHTKVESRWNGVHLMPLSSVLEAIPFFKEVCVKNKTDHLLISNTFWLCTYMNYGGSVIETNFPSTEETAAERRYRVREGNKDKVFERFVFLSVKFDFDTYANGKYKFTVKRLDDWGLCLIENNQLTNKEFIALVRNYEEQ